MTGLAIIIVSWNVRDLLGRCIQTVHASLAGSGISYTIVVVDNASADGTPAMLRAEHPEVCLVEAGRNLGFAGGNNLALRQLEIRDWRLEIGDASDQSLISNPSTPFRTDLQSPQIDYVLLLNPDTEVVGDAIPQLVGYLEAHPDVAVAGPKLLYADGSAQSSRRRFPTLGTFFWESTPLETRWPGNPWTRRYRRAGTPDDVAQEVDWLVGAALLVRRTVIERAGLLDAGFLMYSEELEWQRRIKRLEIRDCRDTRCCVSTISNLQSPKIMYLPDAVIIHHEGKSSEQAPAQRYLNFQRSRLRYARMVYGAGFAAVLRLFLRAAYAGELAIEAAKWLVGHRRALRAQRVGVYWRVVRGL